MSGGISSSIAGGNFWSGARQGLITSGLNHAVHEAFTSGNKTYISGGKGGDVIDEGTMKWTLNSSTGNKIATFSSDYKINHSKADLKFTSNMKVVDYQKYIQSYVLDDLTLNQFNNALKVVTKNNNNKNDYEISLELKGTNSYNLIPKLGKYLPTGRTFYLNIKMHITTIWNFGEYSKYMPTTYIDDNSYINYNNFFSGYNLYNAGSSRTLNFDITYQK